MADATTPPLRAPSASPPGPGLCPNCNSSAFLPIDNNRTAPRSQLHIGRYITMCDECGFIQTQIIHGREPRPNPATSGGGLFP
jgi:hypothetical protein